MYHHDTPPGTIPAITEKVSGVSAPYVGEHADPNFDHGPGKHLAEKFKAKRSQAPQRGRKRSKRR